MFHYVGIENNKITSKTELSKTIVLSEGYKVVNEELYKSIGAIPCSFVEDKNGITSIEYIELISQPEEPKEPTEMDILKTSNESLNLQIIDLWETLIDGGIL